MCKFIKFIWIAETIIFTICIFSLQCFSMEANEGLSQCLAAIRSQNKGKETNWAKLEAECLKLVKDHNSPEEKGKIYATIALIYAEKGYTSREDVRIPKALEYCKKALQHPLEATTACEMYGRWAGSLMVTYWSYPEQEFIKVRQEAIVPCLTGLKLALDNKAPKKWQPPPAVGKYNISPNDPEYQRLMEKYKEEIATREKIMLQNKLYLQRKALTQRCVSLYSNKPYNTEQLKNLSEKILGNYKDDVNELIAQVEEEIIRIEKSGVSDQSTK